MSSQLCRCCLQQQDLTVSLWRDTHSLGNGLGCLGVSVGPLWPTIQLDVTQSQYQKLHLVVSDAQLGLCFAHYLAVEFRLLSCMYVYNTGSVYCGGFCMLVLSIPPPHSSALAFLFPPCLIRTFHPLTPHLSVNMASLSGRQDVFSIFRWTNR